MTTTGDPEFRAVSKIAFNYLAFVGGADFVRLPQFHAIRRFIRYGEKLPSQSVRPGPNPWLIERAGTSEPLLGHYVVIRRSASGIDANVCLFARICYAIRLTVGPFPMAADVAAGHLFDIESHETVPLNARAMPLMPVDLASAQPQPPASAHD